MEGLQRSRSTRIEDFLRRKRDNPSTMVLRVHTLHKKLLRRNTTRREKRDQIETLRHGPEIVDPSFELFKHQHQLHDEFHRFYTSPDCSLCRKRSNSMRSLDSVSRSSSSNSPRTPTSSSTPPHFQDFDEPLSYSRTTTESQTWSPMYHDHTPATTHSALDLLDCGTVSSRSLIPPAAGDAISERPPTTPSLHQPQESLGPTSESDVASREPPSYEVALATRPSIRTVRSNVESGEEDSSFRLPRRAQTWTVTDEDDENEAPQLDSRLDSPFSENDPLELLLQESRTYSQSSSVLSDPPTPPDMNTFQSCTYLPSHYSVTNTLSPIPEIDCQHTAVPAYSEDGRKATTSALSHLDDLVKKGVRL